MMDDHYYMAPEYFASLYHRYDKEPRGQYTIYVGEYACKTDVGIGNLTSAISDAIFLMGCENNGDVVKMTSYAPLFCHQKDRRWSVNLICLKMENVLEFLPTICSNSLPNIVPIT